MYYWEQGRSDEAEQLELEVLELHKEVVGLKHPNTISAMANLASTWQQQGRSDKAERLQLEVLELYKEVVGSKHPDTIRAIENHTEMERQFTLNNTDTRSLSQVAAASNNSDSTQQRKTRIKLHSRLGKWTRELTNLGKRKNTANLSLEGL